MRHARDRVVRLRHLVLSLQANFGLDLASMFAVLTPIATTGVLLSFILRRIELKLCFWSGKATK